MKYLVFLLWLPAFLLLYLSIHQALLAERNRGARNPEAPARVGSRH
jgi:hypothetical protein